MFRPNNEHRQRGVFEGANLLPEKLREKLEASWAGTFYREVFCRIDEEIFAGLYGEGPSRPNVPVNVLVALEILKSGFGWSDRELHKQLCFNLQVRHAVGMGDLGEEVFELRTLYNFRRRVREHEEETGEDLFEKVFRQVTDAQLKAIGTEAEWQRIDSTQVMSNVAEQSRLELIIAVVQKVWGRLADHLSDEAKEEWEGQLSPYLEGRPHEVSFEISTEETEAHLEKLGGVLARLVERLEKTDSESEAYRLAERTLREQYAFEQQASESSVGGASSVEGSSFEEQEGPSQEGPSQEGPSQEGPSQEGPSQEGPSQEDAPGDGSPGDGSPGDGSPGDGSGTGGRQPGRIEPRPDEEVSAESLQSPHDPEATYRRKNGEEYPGGYVVAVSETCDPESEVHMITDVQVAPNTTDDGELLRRSLEAQSERSVAPEQMTVDGGFTGPTAEEACETHQTNLRPTRIRGGRSDPDRLGWEDYEWIGGAEEGRPTGVVCPKGEEGTVESGEAEGRLIARFEPGACEGCPLLGGACRVEKRRKGPTMYLSERSVEVARMRQGIREKDRSVRAPVEATMRSLKRGLEGDKLPTRGLRRAKMVIYGAALMVNVRRLCRHGKGKRAESQSVAEKKLFLAFLLVWRAGGRKIRGRKWKAPRRGIRFD
jgi:hypothetical protein